MSRTFFPSRRPQASKRVFADLLEVQFGIVCFVHVIKVDLVQAARLATLAVDAEGAEATMMVIGRQGKVAGGANLVHLPLQ